MSKATQRAFVIGLILIGMVIAAFYGIRSLFAYQDIRDTVPVPSTPLAVVLTGVPQQTDVEMIREWMTIPYIAKAFQVDPKKIYAALNIPPTGTEEKNLEELNKEFFPNEPGKILALIKAVVQANLSTPTPAK